MLAWLTLPFYDFCGFRSVAVNSVYKLQFFYIYDKYKLAIASSSWLWLQLSDWLTEWLTIDAEDKRRTSTSIQKAIEFGRARARATADRTDRRRLNPFSALQRCGLRRGPDVRRWCLTHVARLTDRHRLSSSPVAIAVTFWRLSVVGEYDAIVIDLCSVG